MKKSAHAAPLAEVQSGLGQGRDHYSPGYETPLDIHETHHTFEGVCLRCGAKETWPAITEKCKINPTRTGRRKGALGIHAAGAVLQNLVADFLCDWDEKDIKQPLVLWVVEFWEWYRKRNR